MAGNGKRLSRAVVAALSMVGMAAAPVEEEPATGLSAREFASLYVKLHPYRQAWTAIPWVVSVSQARVRAARERKPIFMIVNTGNCLGFV